MLKSILTAAVALTVGFSGAAYAATIGAAAPAWTAKDTNGVEHSLSDFDGKTVVMEWTNHQCPFVVKHYRNGDMQATQKSATDDGVVWLRVISSAPGKQGHVDGATANTIATQQGVHATATLLDPDGSLGALYGAKTTPHMYVINADQDLVYAGAIDDNSSVKSEDIATSKNYVTAALANMKAGEAVETASTQPYGCSVKY